MHNTQRGIDNMLIKDKIVSNYHYFKNFRRYNTNVTIKLLLKMIK